MGGLHLLGPDYIAIGKIRCFSVTISAVFPSVMIFGFKAYPGLFYLYHKMESTSLLDDFQNNYLTSLYFILPLVSGILNAIVRAYSYRINKNLDSLPTIFTISATSKREEKFSFSLGSSIGITAILFFGFLSSFSSRRVRLKFFFPVQTMCLSIVLPIFLIAKNEKMNHFFAIKFFNYFNEKFITIKHTFRSSNAVRPR